MKSQILIIAICLCILSFPGCKKDPEPSLSEVATKKLVSKGWILRSVSVDGVDKTSTYAGLTLTFTTTGYTTTNGKVIWPTSGTWSFIDEDATRIKRNDDLEITITDLTDASLILS